MVVVGGQYGLASRNLPEFLIPLAFLISSVVWPLGGQALSHSYHERQDDLGQVTFSEPSCPHL